MSRPLESAHSLKTFMSNEYLVNEIFYTLQGEGHRVGSPSVFIRFTGCNLRCRIESGPKSPGGFDCDTEFASGIRMSTSRIVEKTRAVGGECDWVVLTGGEPGLQIDEALLEALVREGGYKVAIESNGTVDFATLKPFISWLVISPKVAEHAVRSSYADELRYVRRDGQGIPRPSIPAREKFISPAFEGNEMDKATLAWCLKLVKENPKWRLSIQSHKLIGVS